ncbi:hypothetical protein HDV04_006203 [Boothiomyces sp. JEL0838]|nr:hypothetical protein HDV04_006203 [Boothiomyces sp. JEL0838]
MKVLCLHGGNSNKDEIIPYLLPIAKELKTQGLSLHTVDAPFCIANENTPERKLSWLPQASFDFEPAYNRVAKVWDSSYTGILAFSMGSFVAAAVSSRLNPLPRFIIVIGGLSPVFVNPEDLPLDLFCSFKNPSLNVVGNSDKTNNAEHNKQVALKMNSTLVEFDGGHVIPNDTETVLKIAEWVKSQE